MKSKSARGAATRQKILDAAADLVSRQGFNGTSVDDVLAASGTGKSQFYHYFSSKTQLARELVDHHVGAMPLRRLAEGEIGSLAELDAALDALLAAHRDGQLPYGCAVSNLATELVAANDELAGSFRDIFVGLETRLTELLQRLRARGQLRQESSPEAVAGLVAAAIEGGLLLAKVRGSSGPLQAAIGQLKAYLRSLAAKPAGASRSLSSPRPGPLTYCP